MGATIPDIPRPSPRTPLPERLRERCRGFVAWMGPGRLVGGAGVVVATAIGGWWLLHAPPPAVERSLPATTRTGGEATSVPGGTTPAPPATTVAVVGEVVVHVAGAVTHPGLVRLIPSARVDDAIAAAGGPLPEADLDALNLAAPVTDGSRIYVPESGEVVAGGVVSGGAAVGSGPAALVDVNLATAAELDALPGIGPSTAQAIVAHRDAHGPFRSIDDLLDVRGIGPSKLDQFRALITV